VERIQPVEFWPGPGVEVVRMPVRVTVGDEDWRRAKRKTAARASRAMTVRVMMRRRDMKTV
jgi:hypothetical protein